MRWLWAAISSSGPNTQQMCAFYARLIHCFQQAGGMELSRAAMVQGEVEARLLMVRWRHTWSLTNDEVREMIREVRQMRSTGRY